MFKNHLSTIQVKPVMYLAAIIAATFIVLGPTVQNDFVLWDDPAYLLENPLAQTLSWNNTRQIFSTYILGNYHPLTILSFSIEHHFFGLDPFSYHLTNLLLHTLNTVLVYALILRLCAKAPIAALTALLFALHPTRVESVAWVTERKDVLFTAFYLLGLLQYHRYLDKYKIKHLAITFLFFVLALLAKPAAVSFPLAILLLDYIRPRHLNTRSIGEKVPFFLAALAFGLIAIAGTYTPTNAAYPVGRTVDGILNNTVIPLDEVKLSQEIFTPVDNVFITSHALVRYLTRSVWPQPLSPYYPLPVKTDGLLPWDYYCAAGIILLIILLLKLWYNKPARFCALFFFVTIFFNLPIGRIGAVEIADRFTYIPYIGVFYFLALSMTALVIKLRFNWPLLNNLSKTAAAVLILFYAANTFLYTGVWKDSGQLWTRVIHLYPDDPKGYFNRGNYYFDQRDVPMAVRDYRVAIILQPRDPRFHYNLANCYLKLGRPDLALPTYDAALALKPHYPAAAKNRARAEKMLGLKDTSQ